MQIYNVHVQNEIAKRASSSDSAANAKKATKKLSVNAEAASAGASESAKVSISSKGTSGSAEAMMKTMANALPEVREEYINLAKERIQSGYYNTPEFSRELSNRLVEG